MLLQEVSEDASYGPQHLNITYKITRLWIQETVHNMHDAPYILRTLSEDPDEFARGRCVTKAIPHVRGRR